VPRPRLALLRGGRSPAHSLTRRKERRGEIDARPAGQFGRCQGIPDRAQVVELELVGSQPLPQAPNHVFVNSRFASQPLDEIVQGQLAAMKLSRLSSQLGKFTARLRRLVAKSRDLGLVLACLSAKPSKLPVDRGWILRHKLKATKRVPLALANGATTQPSAAIVRRLLGPKARSTRSGASRFCVRWHTSLGGDSRLLLRTRSGRLSSGARDSRSGRKSGSSLAQHFE
jgi:hypothetical protein